MGRLMDAVLAVSAFAMASAVALADWVMSCCGVGSEAMFQIVDSLIKVKSGKNRGRTQNSGPFSPIVFNLG